MATTVRSFHHLKIRRCCGAETALLLSAWIRIAVCVVCRRSFSRLLACYHFILLLLYSAWSLLCIALKYLYSYCKYVPFCGTALNEAESPVITWVQVLGSYWLYLTGVSSMGKTGAFSARHEPYPQSLRARNE